MAAIIDGYKDNKFPIEKFLSLYELYKYNIKVILNTFDHEYVQTDITYSSDKFKQYLVYNFGLYFPIHKLNDTELNTNRIYYERNKESLKTFPINYIKYNDTSKVELFLENKYINPIAMIEGIEYQPVKYNGVDVKSVSLNANYAISIMIYMEQTLADMIFSNIEDFIRLLQTGNEFYPLKEVWGKFRKWHTSMQFNTISSNTRYFTAMSKLTPKTEALCERYYRCFELIISELIKHIKCYNLTGRENIAYSKKLNTLWTNESIDRSISNIGAYLPIVLTKYYGDTLLVRYGENRYDSLCRLNKEEIKYKILGMVLYFHNKEFDEGYVDIYIPSELFVNYTWDSIKQWYTKPTVIDGIEIVKIGVKDLFSLIHYFYLLYREIHNFIDDGYMEMYQIEALNFILPTTEGEII